jgi:hypothetical protein
MHGPSEIVAGTVAPQGDRIHIPTNGEGQIIAKKSVFHRACRQTASVCLDVTIRDFQKHLQSRRWALLLNELEKEFYFNPPLPKDYVENMEHSIGLALITDTLLLWLSGQAMRGKSGVRR